MFGFMPPKEKIKPESEEIAELTSDRAMTTDEKAHLHDEVLDEIRDLKDTRHRDLEAKRFRIVAERGIQNLLVSPDESPGEKDSSYGQFSDMRSQIKSLPTVDSSKKGKITRELDEEAELTPSRPLTPWDRSHFHDEVLDEVRSLPDIQTEKQARKFHVAVEAALRQLPVTSYDSPAEQDSTHGQFHGTIVEIHGLPEFEKVRKIAPIRFS